LHGFNTCRPFSIV